MTPSEKGQPIARSCECRNKKIIQQQWQEAGINIEMTKQTFSNFKIWNDSSKLMKESAAAYYSDFENIRKQRNNSIIFAGQVGSGKSHISIALAINFIKQDISVVYMPYRDVMTEIKQNVMDDGNYKKLLAKYQKCRLLLIDDLFKGKITQSDINIMFEIINYRYLNYLPMIISSEFSINKLLEFDEAIGSRIYEMCKSYVIQIKKDINNNYRLK